MMLNFNDKRHTFFFSLSLESVAQQPMSFILPFGRTLHCISQMVPTTMMPLQEEVLGWMNHSASLALINFSPGSKYFQWYGPH